MTRQKLRGPRLVVVGLPSLARCAESSEVEEPWPTERWRSAGPDGGTVWSLAVAPSQPGRVYAGTPGHGVFRSLDGGRSWVRSSSGLPESVPICLQVDPSRPETVYVVQQFLVYKTTNGGATWECASRGLESAGQLHGLALDPWCPATLYLASDAGLFRSEDAAASWTQLGLEGPVQAVVVSHRDLTTVFAATPRGVVKSSDGGLAWVETDHGVRGVRIQALAIDPASPEIVYAGGTADYAGKGGGVYKSVDGGARWSAVGIGLHHAEVSAFLIDPRRPATVYALASVKLFSNPTQVYRSEDGGVHWLSMSGDLGGATVSALAIHPAEPGSLLAGTWDGGVFRSEDQGTSWRRSSEGLCATEVRALLPSTSDPPFIDCLASGRPARRDEGDVRWAFPVSGLTRTTVHELVRDPGDPATLFARTDRGVSKSVDGGRHWMPLTRVMAPTAIAIDPQSPNTVYLAAGRGIWRTTDGGTTWRTVGAIFETGLVKELWVDPRSAGTLYAQSVYSDAAGTHFFLHRSVTAGALWEWLPTPSGFELAFVLPDAAAPGVLFASDQLGLYRSEDAGKRWHALHTMSLSALVIDPRDPTLFFGGNHDGVFKSTDGGRTWAPLRPTGLTNRHVLSLSLSTRNGARRLCAGTEGGGVFTLALQEP
jgi:photosystem II stability/assembly factor-like uncharacterized protein